MDEFDEDPEKTLGFDKKPVEKKSVPKEEKKALIVLLALLPVSLLLLGHSLAFAISPVDVPTQTIVETPATEYCLNQGYLLEGTSCLFPDGTRCPTIDFYNGTCAHPRNDCSLARSLPDAEFISEDELARGWYFGTCTEKKKGTPGNWLWMINSYNYDMWYLPNNDTGYKCDCML
ncbi:DUF333 domain-containing protein [archaeon]|nr:DUF333 domain-containing protein [archaeon]